MTARANFTADDGAGTPVTHTFTPNGEPLANGVLSWRNFVSTAPLSTEIITVMVRPSPARPEQLMLFGKKVDPRVVEFRLKVPVTYVDTSTGLTGLDFINEGIVRFMLHPRSTEQQAKDLRKIMINAFNNTNSNMLIYAVDKGESIW